MRCALLLGGLSAFHLGSFDAAWAQDKLLPLTVELGDVSLTKLPFVMAAEAGIYQRNGLAVKQFITPNAAELIRKSDREMRLHRAEDFYDARFIAELDRSGYIDDLYKGGAAPR
jgi:hypothetical protein